MACCQIPNPKEDKAPVLPQQSDDRGQPFGLAPTTAQITGTGTAGSHGSVFAEDISTGSPSLVSLSVRLNI